MRTPQIKLSIIIPSYNSANTIESCIRSLLENQKKEILLQTEIIVVDNNSKDLTPDICKAYSIQFFTKGDERHDQRRFGAERAKGEYIMFMDSDMEIAHNGVEELFRSMKKNAVIIGEISEGVPSFWTKSKIFEKTFYVGDDQIEAARMFPVSLYEEVGGFDKKMIAMEDWDLTKKIRNKGHDIIRANTYFYHQEGYITASKLWHKKRYYGSKSPEFAKQNGTGTILSKIYFLRPTFYKNWRKIISNPKSSFGLISMLSIEMIAGALGFWDGLVKTKKNNH